MFTILSDFTKKSFFSILMASLNHPHHSLSIEDQQLPTTGRLEDDNTPFDGNYSHSFC